ncbi:tyrosine-protein kinase receptor torso, partial [Biomphalaria pfeifferi]
MPHTGSRRSRLTTSQRIHFRFSMFAVALTFHASSLAMAVITETALQPSTEKPLGLSLYKMHIISARCHASCKEKCLPKCNTSDSTELCKEECTIPRCISNCETTGRILRDESSSPDPVYVKGQKMQVTVSTPSAACMYSPSGQEDTTEGSTIILGWNVTVADNHTSSLTLYCVVEVYEENLVTVEVKNWTSLDYTNQSVLLISNLSHNSQYKFRVSVVSSRGLITPPVTSKFIQPPKAELPQAPRNISVYQFVTNQTLKAEVKWQLPNNVGCHFKLYWMTSSETKPKLSYKELRDWASYTFEIGQLGFDRNYSLEIQTYDRHFRVSSARALYNFHTLSCLESTQYNYQSCAPDEPQQFQYIVHEPYIVNETTLTNVTLFWKPPLYLRPNNTIEKYVVTWRKDPDIRYINLIKADRGVTLVLNETNEVTLTDIHWNAEYVATVAAESKAGTGHKVSLTFVTGEGYNSQFGENAEDEAVIAAQVLQNTENVYFATIIPAILTAGSITVCVIYFIKFRKQTQHMSGRGASKREQAINPLYEYTLGKQHLTEIEPLIVTDEFEVDYTCLKLTTTLGEGAFGRVMKAEYTPKGSYQSRQGTGVRTVAVKMLKEHATPEERRFLLLEIGTMKTLGIHPNLVSIVACITNSTRPCLIMEYCPLGDLRNYLRQHRLKVNYMTSSSSGVFSGNMSSLLSYSNAGTENLIINSPDPHETMCLAEQELLSQTVLLSYARQIALGM